MIRTVIFDLGHTLWDILPDTGGSLDRAYDQLRATLCERLGRNDLPEAQAIRRAVGDVLRTSSEQYYAARRMDEPPPHTYVDAGCRKLGIQLDEALLREIAPPIFSTEVDRLHVAEGTLEAVRALHDDGYALGCITNTLADTNTIRAMLRQHGFELLMGSVVVSSERGWRKPHRSLFEAALQELAAAPRESAFVGDSPWHDVEGAQNAGMLGILTRQYALRPTDGFAAADATIDHVRELRDVIHTLDAASSLPT